MAEGLQAPLTASAVHLCIDMPLNDPVDRTCLLRRVKQTADNSEFVRTKASPRSRSQAYCEIIAFCWTSLMGRGSKLWAVWGA